MNIAEVKTELDKINKEIVSLEKYLEKIEDEGNYDLEVYKNIDKLECRREELEQIIFEGGV